MHNEPQTDFSFSLLRQGFKTIYKYTKGYRKNLYFIFFLIVVSSTIDAFTPFIWGKLIDAVIAHKVETVFVIFGSYTIILIIQLFADLKKSLEGRWVEENVRRSYVSKNFAHVFKLPLSFHKSAKQGEINEKIRTAGQAIRNIYSDALLQSIPELLTAIIMSFVVLFINPLFGSIIIFGVVLYVYVSVKEIKPTFQLQKESQKGYRKAGGMIQDVFNNIRSVKDFNTEEYETKRIDNVYYNEGFKIWYKMFSIQRTTNTKLGFIRLVVRSSVIILSIIFIFKAKLTVGQMLSVIQYVGLIFGPLSFIFNTWRDIQNGIVSIEEVEKIARLTTENYVPENAQALDIKGEISFKNVFFSYDAEKPVLKNINFHVNAGETIALVGESGVGKSTLIDLLSGFHFPQEGSITVEGVDTKEINLNMLRREVAVVSQEISLFNDTIKNNIAYGSFDKNDDEIKEAARKAHCVDFIEKFPLQWDQLVGEKGLKLSVGQKQRVAIARAILKDPAILILDEPTSALDAGSEKIITESLEVLMQQKTTFIVAHRLSTVRRADTILVFKNGEIVEQGKHNELLKIPNGEYRRLYELQIGLHE